MKYDRPDIRQRIRRQANGICEHCQNPVGSLEVHHCFTKGAGQVDIPGNLIALCGPWDQDCHGRAQRYDIPRIRLLQITARREGTTWEQIQKDVWAIRIMPKEAEVMNGQEQADI